MKTSLNVQRQARLDVLQKIENYEKLGGEYFFADVEDDPPSKTLMPNDVDYLKKKFINKIKNFFAKIIVNSQKKKTYKKFQIEVLGLEYLQSVPGGAIITSNHFSRYENMCIFKAVDSVRPRKKLNIVIKEGNYFMPGVLGFVLKNFNTLPISSNLSTMKNLGSAIETLLARKQFVHIYPEQAMWWNYKKPRNFKKGAYYFATKCSVPVVPCFVTMCPIAGKDNLGFDNLKYTLHIMPPIFPEKTKSLKENVNTMLQKNYDLCKEKYQQVYKTKLTY